MAFVIVRNAAGPYWLKHWYQDPKQTGVRLSDSAHGSRSGKKLKIRRLYWSAHGRAQQDLQAMRAFEPSADYGLCKVVWFKPIDNVRYPTREQF